MTKPLKQIHLAAHFPGVNNTTVWSDPGSGSHIEFSSFAHLARTAERAKFDFMFLAEGLRLREQNGLIYDLDVVGRPDTFTVLAALAAVTDRLGLAGTINSTFNEPYEVARQFASLDHLSGGRAAWNVVTSWDAFTGENFRRGGFLPQDARYERAQAFLRTTRELFDSWRGDEIIADKAAGVFLADGEAGRFAHRDAHFDISGRFNVPRSPQGRPVVFQAGDSDEGREFAAASADAIFSRHSTLADGRTFYADVKRRLARHGRSPDQLLILPAATFVLADTDAAAGELAIQVRRQQVSGQTAIKFLEQLWNRDLSGYDPDGPRQPAELTEHVRPIGPWRQGCQELIEDAPGRAGLPGMGELAGRVQAPPAGVGGLILRRQPGSQFEKLGGGRGCAPGGGGQGCPVQLRRDQR
jgi:FMN-dependent oxidoreductase (nitrilotriacetate monooxygenase family)